MMDSQQHCPRSRTRASTQLLATAALAVLLIACSPTLTVKRTQTLTAAGTAYVQAVEALVADDRDAYIDTDSQLLLTRMHDQPALEHTNPDQARAARSTAF